MSALFALGGSSAVVVGALLPWMTFFAGLQSVRGVSGAYGRALLVLGVISWCIAAVRLVRRHEHQRWVLTACGGIAALSAAVLLARAYGMSTAPAMRMMVPGVGPGLWIILAGGGMLLFTKQNSRTTKVVRL